jgi:hypothetical protein
MHVGYALNSMNTACTSHMIQDKVRTCIAAFDIVPATPLIAAGMLSCKPAAQLARH